MCFCCGCLVLGSVCLHLMLLNCWLGWLRTSESCGFRFRMVYVFWMFVGLGFVVWFVLVMWWFGGFCFDYVVVW